mgnify:CR=1 FL=1
MAASGAVTLLDDQAVEIGDVKVLGVGDPKAPALQLEPAVRQRRLFGFLRRLIQLRTEAEPLVLLLLDYWPLGRWNPGPAPAGSSRVPWGAGPGAALFLEKAPLFVLAAASAAITLFDTLYVALTAAVQATP